MTYDADGQTLTDTSNTYTWDVRRHVTNFHQTGINYGSDFVYDALGRRVEVTDEASGTTTQYLYDGLNPVALAAGTSVTNMLTGLNIDEYFSFTNSTGTASLMTDTLGSIIALTDSTGAVFSNYSYEPFGRQPVGIGAPSSPLITIPFDFTSREDDDGTVLYYRARYYNSYLQQRFLSQDPAEFSNGFNLYAYALNEPTALRDPLGLWVAGAGLNIGAALAGAGASATSQVVWDGKGNVGIATTACAGGIAAVAAVGGGGAFSYDAQASTIFDLQGSSVEIGTAFPVGEGVGFGFSTTLQNNQCGKPIAT